MERPREVIPHGMRCEGLLRVLSWVSFDLPDHYKRILSRLLQAAGEGCSSLHTVPIEGRDIKDDQIANEQDLQQVLIDMVPTLGMGHVEGGSIIRALLTEFLRGFSLRTLIFLMDMVLPQLDAYHSGRQLQHLQPWVSVELAQQLDRGQSGVRLNVTYQYEACASFHVIQLHTDGAILLFSDPMAIPQCSPWDLCVAGNLGSMDPMSWLDERFLGACNHLMVSEDAPSSWSMRKSCKGRASQRNIEPTGGLLLSASLTLALTGQTQLS